MRRTGILLAVLALAAAASGQETPSVVRLAYFANVTHAQAVLGVADGEFAQAVAPAKLSAKVFNAGPSLIEALISGQVDIGYVGPGPALTAWTATHGREITVISGAAANGVLIVAGPKSHINSLADLAGKRVATPQRNNTQDISARHYLLATFAQADEKYVIPVSNPEQVGSMIDGNIDAAWAPEPWASRLVAQAGGKIIGEEKDLWPGHEFSLTVVVARTQFLREHPDVVRQILSVHRAWTAKLSAHPRDYAAQLGSALTGLTKAPLPPGVMEASLSHVKFTDDPIRQTFDTMAQWSVELRVIRQPPPPLDGLFDTSILRQLK